jgi:hypothetical protein
MRCLNDSCTFNSRNNCVRNGDISLNESGKCETAMVINKTCSTCGNMKKEGYKLFCHGWGDPFPDEVQPNGTCGGAWKPR